ncbi:hypothetical protein [Xanthomonas medicagonis]|uniref:hypothetical protein n=1 Tax=Xanthomonas medicagonis TaxID=3160841 RepID=UPI003510D48A
MQSTRQIHARSSRFVIEPGEDDETNPGIFGRAFAQWLSTQLPALGWRVKGCIAEDFGRLVEVEDPKFRLFVACANGHHGDNSWQAFTFAEGGGLLGMFAKADKQQLADCLLADVERVLRQDPSTIDVQLEDTNDT